MPTTPITVRQQLREDFGLDLPIGSGSGSSRNDPLVILASDPNEVIWTEMLLLNCVGKAVGRSWRVLRRNSLDGNVEQLQLETIELTPTEIITQQVNHYFDVSASIANTRRGANNRDRPDRLVAYVDAESRIAFPYEIGWLHFEGTEASDPTDPGLGRLVEYRALKMKGSVYIYDRNITRFPGRFDAEFLLPEFCAAAFDAEHHSKMRSLQNRRVIATQTGTSYMRQDFDIGSNRSVLAMTVARQNYVKLRVTWLAEPVFNDIGNEFIDAVVDLASRHSSVH